MKNHDVSSRAHNIPDYLKQHGHFCVWRYETHNGRTTKIPYDPRTGLRARSNMMETFCSFDEAVSAVSNYSGIGLGIFDGISAIDIDNCVGEAGSLSDMAQDIIDRMDSYTELSPSGKGIRIIFRTADFSYDKERFYIHNQKSGLEVYVAGATYKFSSLTGRILEERTEIAQRDEALTEVLSKYMRRGTDEHECHKPALKLLPPKIECSDDGLIEKARTAKNGAQFSALWAGDIAGYPSQSEADLALCSHLAFWTGKDAERMDSLFRRSGLIRQKWDEKRGGATYGATVIKKAIANCGEVYTMNKATSRMSNSGRIAEITININEETKKLIQQHLLGKSLRYGFTHLGGGNLFADFAKNKARYVAHRKIWFIYDGKRWVPDTDDAFLAMGLCKQLAEHIKSCYLALSAEEKSNCQKIVENWQKRPFRVNVLKDAQNVYPVEIHEFDSDPYVLNCGNGELNVKTLKLTPHHPDSLLTHLAAVDYNPEAASQRWEQFIDEVMCKDEELAVFLQKACGYALTGCMEQECFFVLYGWETRNGKTTFSETLQYLMGDYGVAINPDTIMKKSYSNGSSPSPDIARLPGARLVNTSELENNSTLNASLVKRLTGGDTITARNLYEGFFEFKPVFKLFINTNRLPTLSDQTVFWSERVKVIPFMRKFSSKEQDKGLKAELRTPENLSGILNWCLAGWKIFSESGLAVPAAVRNATDDYQKNCDTIGMFFEEVMERSPGSEVQAKEVFERYKYWCQEIGEPRKLRNDFYLDMASRGMREKRPDYDKSKPSTKMLPGYRFKFPVL